MRRGLAALAFAAVAAGTGAAAEEADGYRVGLCGDHRREGQRREAASHRRSAGARRPKSGASV
ncbi:MAG: hypothetical protein R6V44_02460, partial [Paracoccaceae bacterium]